ncbi:MULTISPECIES: glycosyltransferase [Aeromonas]|uniref:glycosyltransferase family 2 protein n=1 Tax=Aeromonas TaxID=642 RepID=UPI00210F1A7B|nr:MULTISPECIES: glycosyltransferase [Aeromonas]MCQ4054008.1 glycosyltransferase [Aeromonas sp. SG16]
MCKVSVIIPVYNHEKYVEDAIKSVLSQSYNNIELIVVNDGSSDSSHEVITRLIKENEFIYVNQNNKGLSKTLKESLKLCHGKYIAIVASDDIWLEHKIQTQVDYMEQNNLAVACCANVNVINEYNVITQNKNPMNLIESYDFARVMTSGFNIPPATILFRADIVDKTFFDESLKVEDLYLWLKLTVNGGTIDVLPNILAKYRIHSSNTTGNLALIAKYHHIILDRFKSYKIYEDAKIIWSLFSFRQLSRDYKKEAMKYLCLHHKFFMTKDFIIGFTKLIFCWQKNNTHGNSSS